MSLSLRRVNQMYLLVLILQCLNLALLWMPQFVRMILNEALLVLLPALALLWLERRPWRATLRLTWPGWRPMVLSFLLGAGLYPLSVITIALFQQATGYRQFDATALLPHTPLDAVLAFVAYAVMAPLCEEVLFRGVIQPAYESHFGERRAVWWVGGLFVAFHLSFLQGIGIVLLALALGYVCARTRSLAASLALHVGANSMAALVLTDGVWHTGAATLLTSIPALGVGLVIAAAAGWGLRRSSAPEPLPTAAPRPELAAFWPLGMALALYCALIGMELVAAYGTPAALALGPTPWEMPQRWEYEVRNIIEAPVGSAECTMTPDTVAVQIACQAQYRAYEVNRNSSTYIRSEGQEQSTLRWQRTDGRLLDGAVALTGAGGGNRTSWVFDGQAFTVTLRQKDDLSSEVVHALTTPGAEFMPVLARSGWMWQLSGMTWITGATGSAVVFTPDTWRQATQDSGPFDEQLVVVVSGQEVLETPFGPRAAWKVQVGPNWSAWYSTETPPVLLRFHNGMETWVLQAE